MSKQYLEQSLQRVMANGDKCFVPYIMAGDGGLENLVPQLEFLQSAGATMIEIGIPFSDPAPAHYRHHCPVGLRPFQHLYSVLLLGICPGMQQKALAGLPLRGRPHPDPAHHQHSLAR